IRGSCLRVHRYLRTANGSGNLESTVTLLLTLKNFSVSWEILHRKYSMKSKVSQMHWRWIRKKQHASLAVIIWNIRRAAVQYSWIRISWSEIMTVIREATREDTCFISRQTTVTQ